MLWLDKYQELVSPYNITGQLENGTVQVFNNYYIQDVNYVLGGIFKLCFQLSMPRNENTPSVVNFLANYTSDPFEPEFDKSSEFTDPFKG